MWLELPGHVTTLLSSRPVTLVVCLSDDLETHCQTDWLGVIFAGAVVAGVAGSQDDAPASPEDGNDE